MVVQGRHESQLDHSRRSFWNSLISSFHGRAPRILRRPFPGARPCDPGGRLARGLRERREDLYFLFLAGVPALDLVVATGFDALPAPPAPDWPAIDGILQPVWRWYVDYARYLRVARRYLRKEADWESNRFLLSAGEVASVREAV